MGSLTELLSAHHQSCDLALCTAENAALAGDWPRCQAATEAFAEGLMAHFDAEESTLFPAFEARTGMTQGPTTVMREEHGQMRQLLEELRSAATRADEQDFAGATETLVILMAQHNAKEESVLYPMCDRVLADTGALRERIGAEIGVPAHG